MIHSHHTTCRESGVTLLIAFLAMTMSFSLATGIFTLLYSEFRLAAQESDSIQAFYAANTGLECARYWDTRRDNPNTGGIESDYLAFSRVISATSPSPRYIVCNRSENANQIISYIVPTGSGQSNNNRTLSFIMNTASGCVDVSVNKNRNSSNILTTTILSRGRVRAGANCAISDRVVERALEFTYTERLP